MDKEKFIEYELDNIDIVAEIAKVKLDLNDWRLEDEDENEENLIKNIQQRE